MIVCVKRVYIANHLYYATERYKANTFSDSYFLIYENHEAFTQRLHDPFFI